MKVRVTTRTAADPPTRRRWKNINWVLTGAVLTVPIAHHALALEGSARALVRATDPLDAYVGVLLKHVVRTRYTLPVKPLPVKRKLNVMSV